MTVTAEDKMADADHPITWVRDAAVKLRMGDSGMEAMPSMSVMSMVKSTVKKHPNHKALGKALPYIIQAISDAEEDK